jgi:hypothetical protein
MQMSAFWMLRSAVWYGSPTFHGYVLLTSLLLEAGKPVFYQTTRRNITKKGIFELHGEFGA